VAVGNSALEVSDENDNAAIGANAIPRNITGHDNVAISSAAMGASFLGMPDFPEVVSGIGSFNVAIGAHAMDSIAAQDGDNNIAIGSGAGGHLPRTVTHFNTIYIGGGRNRSGFDEAGLSDSERIEIVAAGATNYPNYTGAATFISGIWNSPIPPNTTLSFKGRSPRPCPCM